MKSLFFGLILGASMTEAVSPAISVDYLYKVISLQNWEASQSQPFIKLTGDDLDFIHFSTQDQLKRITGKYWSDVAKYIILKVDMKQVPGKLVYEANPGGTNKYYHLYDGCIPSNAIVETTLVRQ